MGVRVAKGSPGGSREYSHRLIPGLPRRAPGAVHDGSKFSTRREAAGDTPRTRGIPPKWLQDEPASAGQPRGLHPPPPPPRGGNLKAQNQATVSWGRRGGGKPARGPGANSGRGSPEGTVESPRRRTRAGAGPRGAPPPPSPRLPRPGPRSPRARGYPLSRGAHTRTPRRHTRPRRPRRGGPGPAAAPGWSPPPGLPSAPTPTRPREPRLGDAALT